MDTRARDIRRRGSLARQLAACVVLAVSLGLGQLSAFGAEAARPSATALPPVSLPTPADQPVPVVVPSERVLLGREGRGWLERRGGSLVLFVSGTPYEMGYQHGVLLRQRIRDLTDRLYGIGAVEALLNPDKPALGELTEAWRRTQSYIPQSIHEELRGLADGAELPLERVRIVNTIPELFHCSGFALWGGATKDGALYHGRVLDYAIQIGYQEFAVVIVARGEGRNAFVNFTYAGFVGSVTGTNDRQVSFGEMGGGGEGLWDGLPMTFLMRKGLEEADTLEEAVALFRDTPRTCEYYYVISDAKIPDARGLATRPDRFRLVEPGIVCGELPVPMGITDVVLMSGGERFKRLASRVVLDYGSIDARKALELMRRPVSMKSCIQAVLFAPGSGKCWVANAVGMVPASECWYTEFDLGELFSAVPPEPGAALRGQDPSTP